MSDTICIDCGKEFSTKYNLNTHKNKTRPCSKKSTSQNCTYCFVEFANTRNLKIHEDICVGKKISENYQQLMLDKENECSNTINNIKNECDDIIKEKNLELFCGRKELKEKDQIIREKNDLIIALQTELKISKEYTKDLQDRLERFTNKIIEKPSASTHNTKTVNNNTSVNITFFTQEHIDKQVKDNFSRDHLILGARGVAKFTHEYLAKKGDKIIYMCTDPARQVFYFSAEDGTKTKDFKGAKLTKALQKPICDKSLKIVKDAGYAIEFLGEIEDRDEQQERELRLYKFAQERWPDVSPEISMLGSSNFIMELSKLTSV